MAQFETYYWIGISEVSAKSEADRKSLDEGETEIFLRPMTPGRPPIPAAAHTILRDDHVLQKVWLAIPELVHPIGKKLTAEKSPAHFFTTLEAAQWLENVDGQKFKLGKLLVVLLQAYVDNYKAPIDK